MEKRLLMAFTLIYVDDSWDVILCCEHNNLSTGHLNDEAIFDFGDNLQCFRQPHFTYLHEFS
jgi:hypothetical protein